MSIDVENALAAAWPPDRWDDVTVLLAVSGGADSVALLRAMHTLKQDGCGRLLAAHFNHGLRGDESDGDEAFVLDLCRRLDVPCQVGRAAPTLNRDTGGEGLEATARAARYTFFQTTAARVGARYLATGHTADDQVETILHRILRGTGIAGLAGMTRCRPLSEATTLIRPLLGVRRAALVCYLDRLEQPYRVDSSNTNTRFTRNRLRHELLPLLAEQFNPMVDEALLRLGTLAGEVQSVVDHVVEELAERAVADHGKATHIDASAVHDQPLILVRELIIRIWQRRQWPLQSMGYAQWDQLAGMLLTDQTDKQMFPGSVVAERTEDRLRLYREENTQDPRGTP